VAHRRNAENNGEEERNQESTAGTRLGGEISRVDTERHMKAHSCIQWAVGSRTRTIVFW
jgi:hypothetical protein